MATSRPSTASTAPPTARIVAVTAAATASTASVSGRAGLAGTGRSRSTYIRWGFLVPLSRDTRPGSLGIRPGQVRDRVPSRGRDGPEQEADQLVGVGPGVAGQVGAAVVGDDERVHHGAADER